MAASGKTQVPDYATRLQSFSLHGSAGLDHRQDAVHPGRREYPGGYSRHVGKDKPGKDTNFRGMTIFDDTLYVTKGSGSNGLQYRLPGQHPRNLCQLRRNAPTGGLINEPITVLRDSPDTTGAARTTLVATSPFSGFGSPTPRHCTFATRETWLALQTKSSTAEVNVADAGTLATAGLQKWVLTTPGGKPTWVLRVCHPEWIGPWRALQRAILLRRDRTQRQAAAATSPASSITTAQPRFMP